LADPPFVFALAFFSRASAKKATGSSGLVFAQSTRTSVRVHDKTKKNPLTNKAIMNRLNPFAKKKRELLAKLEADRHAARAKLLKD